MRRTVPAIAALGLGLSLTLTGCFANPLEQLTDGLIEGGVEQIIEDQTGVDVDIDGTGASLPDSWPTDVPTPDATVLFSAAAGGTYTASFEITDAGDVDRLASELEAAGYVKTQEADYGGLLNTLWENDVYLVTTVFVAGEGDNTDTLQYSIVVKE